MINTESAEIFNLSLLKINTTNFIRELNYAICVSKSAKSKTKHFRIIYQYCSVHSNCKWHNYKTFSI